MDNLLPGKKFKSLLNLVEADQPVLRSPVEGKQNDAAQPDEWREEELDDDVLERAAMGLGPCVGDDGQTRLCETSGVACDSSDIRLKDDVRCVGATVFGLPLYRFKYIDRPGTYEGVMAHEVLQVMPDAVSRGEDGYYRVNYSALGTSMRRVS